MLLCTKAKMGELAQEKAFEFNLLYVLDGCLGWVCVVSRGSSHTFCTTFGVLCLQCSSRTMVSFYILFYVFFPF